MSTVNYFWAVQIKDDQGTTSVFSNSFSLEVQEGLPIPAPTNLQVLSAKSGIMSWEWEPEE